MNTRLLTIIFAALLLAVPFSTLQAEEDTKPDYTQPASEAMNETAPDVFDAKFTTTAGEFVARTQRDWAPRGADRFYNLVRSGYFDNQKFFRLAPGFVVQWGIHGDPDVSAQWRGARIIDDPIRDDISNTVGRVVFANAGPNTRTTQLFINLGNNDFLDDPRKMRGSVFAPFGEITQGMDVVNALFQGYGERPDQGLIQTHGNAYLEQAFPKLDGIVKAEIVEDDADAEESDSAE